MDDFSDDGFDELNDTVLQELENKAIQLTQAQTFNQTQAPPQGARRQSRLDAEDEDLDDSVVFDELAQQPAHPLPTQQQTRIVPTAAQHHRLQRNQPPTSLQRPSHAAATISSRPRYPDPPQLGKPRDTRAINGRAEPFQRPPPPRAIPPVRPAARPSVAPAQFAPPPSTGRPLPGNFSTGIASQAVPRAPPGPQSDSIIAALQARLNSLQTELTTAKGEAAILRTKFLGAQEAHEADLARIRKENAEQLARQERIAEQALAAEKTVTTELHFAQQDLRDERGARTRKGKKEKGKDAGNATTPKKRAAANGAATSASRSKWAMPDGFDDVELMPSPSKSDARRTKDAGPQPPILSFGERTPSKGKRKRPAVDSPLLLELETYQEDMVDGSPAKDEPGASNTRLASLSFDFLTLVLDHGALHGHPLTFELFYRYSFPSDQAQTFGSIISSKLPLLGNPQDPILLLVDFCLLIIGIWRRCLEEQYYEPIYDLVALVSFTLQLRTVQVAPHIVAHLLPTAQSTVSLVSKPRFESVDGDLANNPDPGVQRALASVDTTPVLGLMHLAALGCAGAPSDLDDGQEPTSPLLQYWTMLQPEFIVMLLSHKQKPDDFFGILALLRTSALQGSLGPVILGDDSSDVHVVARVLIERISYYLSFAPRWAPRRSRRLCEVKLAALQTLVSFARTSFGVAKLIQSDHAIPRLVTALSGALDMLYDMEIPTSTFALHDDVVPDPFRESPPQDEPQDPNMTQEDPQASASASAPSKKPPGATAAIDAAPIPARIEDDHPPTALLHAIISASVLLLHTLVTASPPDEAGGDAGVNGPSSVAAKLAASHGGSQRYLLALARINFAEEDLVLEAGIDSETAELANELLELAVTPDEGEGVRDVFGFEET